MVRSIVVAACCLGLTGAAFAQSPSADARMNRYFSIWSNNERITPEAVRRIYASRAIYYGRAMTPEGIYRDKRAFIERWPNRTYKVVPGTVAKTCDARENACRVTAVLSWETATGGLRSGARGANTITLNLVREDGVLKVARESGTPLARSHCQRGSGEWTCSPYLVH